MTSDRPLICGYLMKGPGVPCGLPADHEPPHRPESVTAMKPVKPGGTVLSRVEQQDAAYREQLGIEPGSDLPSAIGGEARIADDARDADRPRRVRRRRWSAVTTTSVEKHVRQGQPETNTPRADEPGT